MPLASSVVKLSTTLAGLCLQPVWEERGAGGQHLLQPGLPKAAGGVHTSEARCGQRRGGGEQSVVLCVASALYDPCEEEVSSSTPVWVGTGQT